MAEMKTAKYIRTGVTRPSRHTEVTAPIITLTSDEEYGNLIHNVLAMCSAAI